MSNNKDDINHNPSLCEKCCFNTFTCCGNRWLITFRAKHPALSKFLFYSLSLYILMVIGGIIFHHCEFEHEKKLISEKMYLLNELKSELNNATYSAKLDRLISLSSVPDSEKNNRWTFSGSQFFAFTTASTIGYGFQSPVTSTGRAFTFIWGLPAIAFFGLAMVNIGTIMSDYIDEKMKQRKLKQTLTWQLQDKDNDNSNEDNDINNTCCRLRLCLERKRIVVILFLLICLILIGSILLIHSEDFTFGEGCYFVWISVSTIGYGDVEPNNAIGRAPVAVNAVIYFGLALVAVLVGTIQDVQQDVISKWRFEKLKLANSNSNSSSNSNSQESQNGAISNDYNLMTENDTTIIHNDAQTLSQNNVEAQHRQISGHPILGWAPQAGEHRDHENDAK